MKVEKEVTEKQFKARKKLLSIVKIVSYSIGITTIVTSGLIGLGIVAKIIYRLVMFGFNFL